MPTPARSSGVGRLRQAARRRRQLRDRRPEDLPRRRRTAELQRRARHPRGQRRHGLCRRPRKPPRADVHQRRQVRKAARSAPRRRSRATSHCRPIRSSNSFMSATARPSSMVDRKTLDIVGRDRGRRARSDRATTSRPIPKATSTSRRPPPACRSWCSRECRQHRPAEPAKKPGKRPAMTTRRQFLQFAGAALTVPAFPGRRSHRPGQRGRSAR